MRGLETHPPVVKLRWFARGCDAFDQVGEDIVMTDLRMGAEPDYVFRFKVARAGNPRPVPVKAERLEVRPAWRFLGWVWKRIRHPMPVPNRASSPE